MADRGKFITLEGVEGTGKTTQCALLCDYLRRHDIDVLETREPGGTPLGEDIRGLLPADLPGSGVHGQQQAGRLLARLQQLAVLFLGRRDGDPVGHRQRTIDQIDGAAGNGDRVVAYRVLGLILPQDPAAGGVHREEEHRLGSQFDVPVARADGVLLVEHGAVEHANGKAATPSFAQKRFDRSRVLNCRLELVAEQFGARIDREALRARVAIHPLSDVHERW